MFGKLFYRISGFIVSIDKRCFNHCQIGEWLGFINDLVQGQFCVPEQKLNSSIRSISLLDKILVRALASIVGQIMSMALHGLRSYHEIQN